MAVPSRHVELEGAWNFRDLGGYMSADGRMVRWRRLFRADGLDRLTDADLSRVSTLGLRTVVDLRTSDEVARGRSATEATDLNSHAGSGPPAWHHLPMLDVLPPREDYGAWAGSSYVADQYLAMVDSAAGTIATFLELLFDPEAYPVVYHCFAGKDRTGVLTALVLGLVGVPDDDIVADYALSKVAMHRLLDWLREQYGEQIAELESSAAAIVAAEPETMSEFLARFRARYGSFDAYAEGIGHPEAGQVLAGLLLEGS
jgi:protein tyrosine/serine phosphatase